MIKRIVVSIVFILTLFGSSLASATPVSHSLGAYVFTTPYVSCEWAWNSLGFDATTKQVVFTSEGLADGPDYCSNKNFISSPGSLSMEQDIWSVEANTVCNVGPRIANDGYWTYGLSTSWTTTVKNLYKPGTWCGSPGHYFIRTIVYLNDPYTGRWLGGYMDGQKISIY